LTVGFQRLLVSSILGLCVGIASAQDAPPASNWWAPASGKPLAALASYPDAFGSVGEGIVSNGCPYPDGHVWACAFVAKRKS